MTTAPFPTQPHLTAVAVMYTNDELIADAVSPRLPVTRQEFKYLKHAMAEGFTIPDTHVGRRGVPAEVEFSATEVVGTTQNYALDDPIPQDDIDNAPPNYQPVDRAVQGVTDLILLDREKRVADQLFALATYAASQRATLSGTSQWSDTTNSNPRGAIATALDIPVMRPNVMVVGQAVWTILRQHPTIVSAILGNAGTAGMVSRQQVADLFELEEVVVGRGFLNTARRGQPATMQRVWGKHAALIRRDRNATAAGNRPTFAWTAEWRTRMAGAMPDPKIGAFGGQRVRVAESVAEVISAPDLGYFFQNAVA